jgi:hypothetical protein
MTPPPARPPIAPFGPRRVIVRLNPDLTDSPLRRALHDANLRASFGIDTDATPDDQENPTP